MPEQIIRALQLDTLEMEGDGRSLHARLFKWGTVSRVQDNYPSGKVYPEEWMRGVFSQSIKHIERSKRGWPLMYNHAMHGLPIGIVSMIHERDDGPWMTSRISRTALGDDIVELIKDGAIPGVSLNGRNIRSRRTPDGVIQRCEVAVDEISVTPFPQLVGADELVLRSRSMTAQELSEIEAEPVAPARDDLSEFLTKLHRP